MSRDIFSCHNLGWGGGTTGIEWVEAKDAVKHTQYTGWSPTAKTPPAPNVNNAKAEKPYLSTKGLRHFQSFLI